MWDRDINNYCQLRGKDPIKVSAILLRKGWNPVSYRSSMRQQLFDFLDKWYTLSVKNLPAPATNKARRRNPLVEEVYSYVTRLPGGWTIISFRSEDGYTTNVLRQGLRYSKIDATQEEADQTHLECVGKVLND